MPFDEIRRSHRILAILALAMITYGSTLRLGFFWDDHIMIEKNPMLTEWSATTLKHDFTSDLFDGHGDLYYRPAQTILNRIDYTLWGLRPFGYHLTNFLGHVANALLIQELIIVLGLGGMAGLLAACLFVVHPIPVEQLMIIAGRAEIIGFTFVLFSLLFLLRERKRDWALGYACYVVALFLKESALVTPLLLACLYAYRKDPKCTYWRLLPYLIFTIPYLLLRRSAVGPLLPHADAGYLSMFFFKAFPKILLNYAQLIIGPWNLHSHRMVPHLSQAWPLLLAFIVVLPFFLYRKNYRLGLLGLTWFVLCFLPKTPIMAYGNFTLDHWAYPASFGILMIMAVGYSRLWERRTTRRYYWLGMTFFPVLISWALLVHLNVVLRGTDEKMYRWALRFTESHPIKYNLGILLLKSGRAPEAIPYFEDVRAAYPEDLNNLHALALSYWETGHPKVALKVLNMLVHAHPTFEPAIQSLKAATAALSKR